MAKRQSRRGVSLSRSVYAAATQAAAAAGVSCSEWVTQLIRGAVPDLPAPMHVRPARDGEPSYVTAPAQLVVHVPNATARPPVKPVTRTVTASFCAMCTSTRGPFVLAPFGRGGAPVAICKECDGGGFAEAGHP